MAKSPPNEVLEPTAHLLDRFVSPGRSREVRVSKRMDIYLAQTDAEIAACYPVMRELRPHLDKESFVVPVRAQEQAGYVLGYVQHSGRPVAVAGFRLGESLAWGRFLFVDDLVVLPGHRSRGYGAALLSWLAEFAAKEGCEQLHLDSGIQRKEARRFYEREGMKLAIVHFSKSLAPHQDAHKRRSGQLCIRRRTGRCGPLGREARAV